MPDESQFLEELTHLINKHSQENESNTPDFILAIYLKGCLATFSEAIQLRENWYGRDPRPGIIHEVTTEGVGS